MKIESAGRRDFLRQAGLMGSIAMMAGLPEKALAMGGLGARITQDAAAEARTTEAPSHHIRFAVCGMSHDHIYGMAGAVQRGGGELAAAWGGEQDKLANFSRRYPSAKIVKTQEEILDDPNVQLVLTSQVPDERAGIAIRAMRQGKDVLTDKPGMTTLEQLAEIR
ncbi:MAG TPA: Gfo/Idh/MocA family oxidoreductase, partial [Candidatus Angelobacter sp.]|nr:Gfo/Idh/MocA family oxidoreductase [Candidatus Angelobacter sp.]